jgi:predicted nuclease with RNAse H fold
VPGVLGVDVSLGRGLDAVLLEDGVVKETWTHLGAGHTRDLVEEYRPLAVAVDAPPRPGLGLLRNPEEAARLPVPPRPGTHLARRIAEYELSRRGIGSHQTHYEEALLFSWMTAGFELYGALAKAGYPAYLGRGRRERTALEVFPYASYVALAGCLSPGRRWRLEWRQAVLSSVGVRGLAQEAPVDQVDAACAAFTAERFLLGEGCTVGDPREGVIVLPVAELQERYRRCAAPAVLAPRDETPRPTRLCECGCGLPVRHRFVPGHAVALRARLIREARAGQAARKELARLGWMDVLKEDGAP